MKKICVINLKGGVGKTTSVINLGSGLSRFGKKVLIIDLDPQANVDDCLPVMPNKRLFDLLIENAELKECITHMGKDLDIITSDERLTRAEIILSRESERETILSKKLKGLSGYDYVLIDCPPSYNTLSMNALYFAQEAFVPVSTDVLGFHAVKKTMNVIDQFNNLFDHNLKVTKVIPTLHDRRNKINKRILTELQNEFYELVTDPISVNSKLKEAPQEKKSIFAYDKNCKGAKDYMKLVENVIYSSEVSNVDASEVASGASPVAAE